MLTPRIPSSRRIFDAAARISRRTVGSGRSMSRRRARTARGGESSDGTCWTRRSGCRIVGRQIVGEPLAHAFRCQPVIGQVVIVYTASARSVPLGPLPDRAQAGVGAGQTQRLITVSQGPYRVSLQIGERDVD